MSLFIPPLSSTIAIYSVLRSKTEYKKNDSYLWHIIVDTSSRKVKSIQTAEQEIGVKITFTFLPIRQHYLENYLCCASSQCHVFNLFLHCNKKRSQALFHGRGLTATFGVLEEKNDCAYQKCMHSYYLLQ